MENAQFPTKEEPSAPNSANSTGQTKLTPRQSRRLLALLTRHPGIPRESVERITRALNALAKNPGAA
jgi:hypothetical protein